MTEFTKDVEAVNSLFQIITPLHKLQEELDDTILLAGSEAYTASLVFYSTLKSTLAAGQSGLKTFMTIFRPGFPDRPPKKPETAAKY